MNTYDHKDPVFSSERSDRHESSENPNSFRRDDSRSSKEEETASAFFKDKRTRIARPRINRDEAGKQNEYESPRRHSFNPNFTRDNRRRDDGRTGNERTNENRTYYRSDRSREEDRRFTSRDSSSFRRNDKREEERRPDRRYENEQNTYRLRNNDRNHYNDRQEGESRRGNDYEPRRNEGEGRNAYRRGNGFRPDNKRGNFRPGEENRFGKSRDDRYKKRKKNDFPTYDKDNYPRFEPAPATGAIRLNRFIANSGICSRREADELIQAGVVSVNGEVVTTLGSKVNPTDEVRFNGEIIRGEKKVYILMNKPRGYVTSMEDPHADKTVMDLLKDACKERVYPVGRLDKNSVGVLLFTNDGELTRQLTHPTLNKKKIYQVTLNKSVTQADMQRLVDGMDLEDGPMYADEVSYVGDSRKEVGIEIHSGRNRIVRRMFEALGYTVQKLDRVYFGGLTKKKLKRGAWRFLTPMEVSRLKSGEYE